VRVAPFLIIALVGCGGSTPIPGEELLLRIETGSEVQLGRAFPLTVVRVWSRELTPSVWKDEDLAPLTLKLVDTRRRENKRRIEETREYEGYAFALGEISLPGVEFRAVAQLGGAEHVVTAKPVQIEVRTVLDPTAPGDAELPGDPLPAPRAWIPWILAGAVLVALGAFVAFLMLRKRVVPEPPPAPPTDDAPTHADIALHRLERCSVVELPDVLRAYIAARFGVRTTEASSEELLANSAISGRDRLAEVLRPCDLAKFACHEPTEEELDSVRGTAATFVKETH